MTHTSATEQPPAEHQAVQHPAAEHESPLEHIVQHPLVERPANLGPLTPDGKITLFSDQIAMLALAGVLLIAIVPMVVKRRRGTAGVDAMVPTGLANGLEAVCEYLRKEVAEPALHEHTDRFVKYIWSVFFFVLTVNILGIIQGKEWSVKERFYPAWCSAICLVLVVLTAKKFWIPQPAEETH